MAKSISVIMFVLLLSTLAFGQGSDPIHGGFPIPGEGRAARRLAEHKGGAGYSTTSIGARVLSQTSSSGTGTDVTTALADGTQLGNDATGDLQDVDNNATDAANQATNDVSGGAVDVANGLSGSATGDAGNAGVTNGAATVSGASGTISGHG